MILFCDTSALVKLYVREKGSEVVRAFADEARLIGVCRVTWVEFMAAVARRARECPADTDVLERVRQRFRADWPRFAVVEVTATLAELAGDYADSFALRAYDSLQLAAARTLQEAAAETLHFSCFDLRLNKAAAVLGMGTHGA